MYKLCFYVPLEFSEKVKAAVFLTGAGCLGQYDQCCWETVGTGQFRALSGSHPFIGEKLKLEKVNELRVEMVCEDHLIQKTVAALKEAHPYEQPAYDVIRVEAI